MSDTIKQPEILVDTYGSKAPKAARAGIGARNLDEIKEATNARPKLGDYDNSNNS
jgi:hypothetical protein